MTNPTRLKWNNKYEKHGLGASKLKPSDWLVNHEELLKTALPGLVLDIACGNGGNTFYLADLGFEVEAFDISDVAIDRLKEEAVKNRLTINPIQADLEQIDLDENKYDVIINFNYLQRSLFSSIKNALKPGGLLFFETMNMDHIDILGHEFNREFTLQKNELQAAFPALEILDYKEGIVIESGEKERYLSSLVGRKSQGDKELIID